MGLADFNLRLAPSQMAVSQCETLRPSTIGRFYYRGGKERERLRGNDINQRVKLIQLVF